MSSTTNSNFPTGYVTNYLQNAIKQISFSGKAMGQKIPSTSGINANVTFSHRALSAVVAQITNLRYPIRQRRVAAEKACHIA